MNEGEIIYLKSSGPKMIIEMVIKPRSLEGGLENIKNDTLTMTPHARIGDYAVKWGADNNPKQDILPKETVVESLDELIKKRNDEIELGNVVKSKLTNNIMTVTWVVGKTNNPDGLYDYNDILKMRFGLKDGDIVCRWFENNELETAYFKSSELNKIME